MKILHLLSSSSYSGAENVVCQIINMMKELQDVESVYCSCDGNIRRTLDEKRIKFCPVKNMSTKEIKQVLQVEKPDIIHAHDRKASLLAALCCGKTPFISHIHGNAMSTRHFSVKAIAYLFAALKAKHIFWVSQSSFDGFVFNKSIKKKSSILYNIIDIDALYSKLELDNQEYKYDVIFVGRIAEEKDPMRLLDVFRLVADEITCVRLAIVGTGDMEKEVKEKITQLELESNVFCLGYQSNPFKLMDDAKVMLMTSKYEGTPMCAIEALALGLPIVSTPADGMKVLIQNGENGYLSDDNEALARNVINIIQSSELRERLSNNAKIFSQKYNNIQEYSEKIFKMYCESLIGVGEKHG